MNLRRLGPKPSALARLSYAPRTGEPIFTFSPDHAMTKLNPKSESRNPKQRGKIRGGKGANRNASRRRAARFQFFLLTHWNLFRISRFGFRICLLAKAFFTPLPFLSTRSAPRIKLTLYGNNGSSGAPKNQPSPARHHGSGSGTGLVALSQRIGGPHSGSRMRPLC